MQINCDNAAQKSLTESAKRTMINFIDNDFGNPSSIYSKGRNAKRALEEARSQVAESIGADADEIYFTSGSTEAINWLYHSTNKHILISPIEHKAILKGNENYDGISYGLDVKQDGVLDIEKLEHLCNWVHNEGVAIVGWVNNEIGTIQPIKKIAEVCHTKGVELFVDASQAIGHIPIDVHEIGMDYMCGSFQKIGGLAGSGFLYIKKGKGFNPMLSGGSQEHGMRAGTENLLGILCGAAAITEAAEDIDLRNTKQKEIQSKIIFELLKLPKSHLNGSSYNRVANNVNICFEGIEAESLVLMLDLDNICVSSGSACNSGDIKPSHVLKAIGLSDDNAKASIRITFGDMTDSEIDYLVERIKVRVNQLRDISPKWKEVCYASN